MNESMEVYTAPCIRKMTWFGEYYSPNSPLDWRETYMIGENVAIRVITVEDPRDL